MGAKIRIIKRVPKALQVTTQETRSYVHVVAQVPEFHVPTSVRGVLCDANGKPKTKWFPLYPQVDRKDPDKRNYFHNAIPGTLASNETIKVQATFYVQKDDIWRQP